MVTLPVEGRWSIRPLSEDDPAAAMALLRRAPLINVYLISRLIEEPAAAAAQVFIVRLHGEMVLAASLSTNIVLAANPTSPPEVIDTATALIAERIINRMLPVRAIISPAPLVESLWRRLRMHIDPPTVVRMNQPIYAMTRRPGFPELTLARLATRRDLDQLVPACAAMHKEEVGIDPMDRDPAGYRERIRELVDKKRSVIRCVDGNIVAKCEFSAITDDAAQLMGVWTDPRQRRRGYASELLREVCGSMFREGRAITLFVNDFNRPAIRLYESLGFEHIGVNRALIW